MSEANPWKTLSSRVTYENAWIKVRQDEVIRPDGNPGIYGVVETRAATGVVALDDQNHVYLVGQYRYPLGAYSWELPEGGAEIGEDPLSAIQRELQEEAGLLAADWSVLASGIALSNCHSNERAYLYLARGLTPTQNSPEGTEVLSLRRIPFSEALQMALDGRISDAMTILGLMFAEKFLANS